MFDKIAYEHGADLRRAAVEYRRTHGTPSRSASRAHRAAPRLSKRLTAFVLHRPAAPVGCEA